jgi:Metallo-peptidase family M12B Reprolysin-like
MHRSRFFCFIAALVALCISASVIAAPLWTDVAARGIATAGQQEIVPLKARTMSLNLVEMQTLLSAAPSETDVAVTESKFLVELPTSDGGFALYRVVETAVMAPELAARYPMLKTYLGQQIDEPSTTVRFDLTNRGFRAQFIASTHTSYIEPFQRGDVQHYNVFNKADYPLDREPMRCEVTGAEIRAKPNLLSRNDVSLLASGANLRTYRIAVAATGEYTTALGGTKLDALSGIVTTMNRVNGIYEREISVRMQLVANNDLIIYTDGVTDPYTNSSGNAMLGENQSNLTTVIGSANYDVGHVFSTGGGGIASRGSVCVPSAKARGVTGSGTPRGDGFDVDYVAHELGHQFDGDHTFNGTTGSCSGNRSAGSAYETGSGSSIQAYAGICDVTDIQAVSDPYFHRRSLDQLLAFTTTGSGAQCGLVTSTGNTPPTVTAPTAFSIPHSTPFSLTATGADTNGDSLTYTWEQFDLGAANATSSLVAATNGPMFRSFAPSRSPTRLFPSLRYILNNANDVPDRALLEGFTAPPDYFTGERLPADGRAMNFRVTVRDNRAGGGGTEFASTQVSTVAGAGPFTVTAPNISSVVWNTGATQTVTWNVANTNAAPISTTNVELALSVDGGLSFPHVIASSVPNTGSYSFTLPATIPATATARVRVSAVGNIFFDISDANFTVASSNTVPSITVTGSINVTQGGAAVTSQVATVSDAQQAAGTLTVSISNVPVGITVNAANNNGNVSLTASADCSVYAPTSGSKPYPMLLSVTDSNGATNSAAVNLVITGNAMPAIGTYNNVTIANGASTTVVPSAPITDANGNLTSTTVTPSALPGSAPGVNITVASNGTVTVNTDVNTVVGPHTIRVQAGDSCGAVRIREFTATVQPAGAYLQYVSSALPLGNGIIERGECNPLNITLTNVGTAPATAVTATLWSNTPGVLVTQPNASLPDVAVAGTQSTSTAFQVSTSNSFTCGADANFTLVINNAGGNSPRTTTFSLPTGVTASVFSENFDALVAPALPNGWTTQVTGATPPAVWATAPTGADTAPNAAFTNGAATVSSNSVVSPPINLPAAGGAATVSFRSAWNFENGFDGGVLEISTDNGTTYNDITSPAIGGSFVSGGYNGTLSNLYSNPIRGRAAWTGAQSTFVTTSVALPASLNGQTIRLRFRAGWDDSTVTAGPNWRIDGIGVVSGRTCVAPGPGACVAPAILNVDDSSAPDVYASSTDALILLRYLFGVRDTALIVDAVGTNPQRNAAQIAAYITSNIARFDVDGDGLILPQTDGLMIYRRLVGLSGSALTTGAKNSARTDVEIANAIDALRP